MLDFDGPELDRHEKRLLIRAAMRRERVQLDLPTATGRQCENGQRVLSWIGQLDRLDQTIPSVEAIAKGTGLSESVVKRTTSFLKSLGVLIVIDRGCKTNQYTIDWRRLATLGQDEHFVRSNRPDKRPESTPQTAENEPTKSRSKELTFLTSLTLGENRNRSQDGRTKRRGGSRDRFRHR